MLGAHLGCVAQQIQMPAETKIYQPKYIVLTAFPPEWDVWSKKSEYSYKQINLQGLSLPMHCSNLAVCVVNTGEGQVNAAVSVTSILLSNQLDIKNTIFIRSGTAGGVLKNTSPIGSVYINSWVVSWGLGRHYLDQNKQLAWVPPKGWEKFNQSTTSPENVAYQINPVLFDDALAIANQVKLNTTPAAQELNALYKMTQEPRVMVGVTVTANNYWSGHEQQSVAEKIVETYTKGRGSYTNAAMEDIGDLDALNRFGLSLNYLSIRAISDIDIAIANNESKSAKVNLAGIPDHTDLAVQNAVIVTQKILSKWVVQSPK